MEKKKIYSTKAVISAKKLLEALEWIQNKLVEHKTKALQTCLRDNDSMEDLVDQAFLLDQAAELAKTLSAELGKLDKTVQKMFCLKWISNTVNVGKETKQVKGQLTNGHGMVRSSVKLPKRGTPEFDSLLAKLGLNKEAIESGIVQIHWPSAVQYFSKYNERGEPLPEEINPTTELSYYTQFRQHEDIVLEDIQIVLRENKDVPVSPPV